MRRAAARASWMADGWRGLVIRGGVIAVLAALLMTMAGAFGTWAWPFPVRLAYWLAGFLGGTVVSIGLGMAIGLSGWFPAESWRQSLAIVLLNTLFYTGAIWLISRPLYPDGRGLLSYAPAVFVISLAMTAVHRLAARRPLETHAGPAEGPPARFLARLPAKLRGATLEAVEAEDHYLRLHTDRGSDLILMRLSDAIAELAGIEGAQTHRSWWVAKDAIADARRANGRAVLKLRSGAEAPVSRTYLRALKDEGWV